MIDYPVAFNTLGEEEWTAIARVHASKQYTMGEEVAAFEQEFAAYHGLKHAIMVNSGSSANLLMIAALFAQGRLKQGDVALVPALAWATTYAPLVQHGLVLRLLDCDATWNAPVAKDLPPTKLIVGCSILGNPAYASQWFAYARNHAAIYIEDNCESIGARFAYLPPGSGHGRDIRWQLTGTLGLMNSFSFFWSHQLSAIEGGMVLTDDDECAELCCMLRDHGMVRGQGGFDSQYDFRIMGYNLRPLELHAAIASEQLKKIEAFQRQRVQNENNFQTWAMGLPIAVPLRHGRPSPFGIQFRVTDNETRLRLANELRAGGVDCRLPTGGSFHLHKYGVLWADQPTSNADIIHRTGMFLGNAPFPLDEKIQRAVKVMRGVL